MFMYVGIVADGVLQPITQVNSTGNYSNVAWPMSSYMSGVVSGASYNDILINILDGINIQATSLQIYIGYGTSPDEMIAANRYQQVY